MSTVIVCGGREYRDWKTARGTLSALWLELQRAGATLTVVTGGAPGADRLARDWARDHRNDGVRFVEVAADWVKHGDAAGPIRNQLMLDRHQPDLVIAFPGGKGTADMVRRAKKARVPVREVV